MCVPRNTSTQHCVYWKTTWYGDKWLWGRTDILGVSWAWMYGADLGQEVCRSGAVGEVLVRAVSASAACSHVGRTCQEARQLCRPKRCTCFMPIRVSLVWVWCRQRPFLQSRLRCCRPVILSQPKYRWGHPKNCLFCYQKHNFWIKVSIACVI